jgi:hypothetical protein
MAADKAGAAGDQDPLRDAAPVNDKSCERVTPAEESCSSPREANMELIFGSMRSG